MEWWFKKKKCVVYFQTPPYLSKDFFFLQWCRAKLWAPIETLCDLEEEWQSEWKQRCCFDHGDTGCPIVAMRSLWWVRPNTWWEEATGAWDAALWLGEATAVYRCSHVLSRCSTSPSSNWQMALDARWFNGLCEVFFFFLPQPAISRDICNDLARRTAESGRWEQHFLMGVCAIVTDFGGNLGTQRYYFWVDDNNFKLSTSEGKSFI